MPDALLDDSMSGPILAFAKDESCLTKYLGAMPNRRSCTACDGRVPDHIEWRSDTDDPGLTRRNSALDVCVQVLVWYLLALWVSFLDATSHLYMRLCPSVCPSVTI